MTFEPPKVIDPTYLMDMILMVLAEVDDMFGFLRNADDEGRLQAVSEILESSDAWLDWQYERLGISEEMRAQAASMEMIIMEKLKNFIGDRPDYFDFPDTYPEDNR